MSPFFRICLIIFLFINSTFSQNPIIRDQFTADPSARVFNGKVYVYPSHDILAKEGRGRIGWFCMEDYHVFSSENLTEWTDHGIILSQDKVEWVKPQSFSLWAPDCVSKNGKYYFYFPAPAKDTARFGKGFSIGVAISDKPEGPFLPHTEPIKKVRGIDPNVFIDSNGQAYLYWSMGAIFIAKLKDNMYELDSEPQVIANLPEKGLKEGPWLFERNGIYYLTFPHVENKTERLEYAMGSSPTGPFKVTGVIMDESPTGCWTNHQSVINYKNQWFLFYHHNDLSPKFDKNRSICIDSLFFNADGTIRKVKPTFRGVGITNACNIIETDRYSFKSNSDVSFAYLDTMNTFKGWKVILGNLNAWVQYNAVDFGDAALKKVQVRANSKTGSIIEIRLNNAEGPLISKIKIPKSLDWKIVKAKVTGYQKGINNLVLVSKDRNPVEIDWVQFIK